jgi:tetratricopeptide (TPR) repeat protein
MSSELRFQAWRLRGAWLYELKQYAKAEEAHLQAIGRYPAEYAPLQPDLSEAYRFLGLTQWSQDRLEEAVPNLARAVELNARSIWAHIHYGKALYAHDQHEAAASELDMALQLGRSNPAIWKNIITFWRSAGNTPKVAEICGQAQANGLVEAVQSECADR